MDIHGYLSKDIKLSPTAMLAVFTLFGVHVHINHLGDPKQRMEQGMHVLLACWPNIPCENGTCILCAANVSPD